MITKANLLVFILTIFESINAQKMTDAINNLNYRSEDYLELNQSQEILFKEYLNQLNKDNIYRIVTTETCNKYKSGILNFDEENGNQGYPLQITFKKAINYNNNFLIKFELDNCVGGSVYYRDFAFFTKNANNEITYNKKITNDLKTKFYQFVISKFNEGDRLCKSNEYNYIFTDGLNITTVKNNFVYGKYVLYGINAPNCCPEYTGDFQYNLDSNSIEFKNEFHESLKENNPVQNEIETINISKYKPKEKKSISERTQKTVKPFSKTEAIAYNAYVDWALYCIKTKNKHSEKIIIFLGLALEYDFDKPNQSLLHKWAIETLIKSKTNASIRNKIFEFYSIEPDVVELEGNFVPWDYNKYSEKQQLAIGLTIGKYIVKNFK